MPLERMDSSLRLVCGLLIGLFYYTLLISLLCVSHMSSKHHHVFFVRIHSYHPSAQQHLSSFLSISILSFSCRFLSKFPTQSLGSAKSITCLSTFALNLSLILICNPSIANPGPKAIKILYNNVRGLVHPPTLGRDTPELNMTKVSDMQGYIFEHQPDIIVLNETWLKPTINSSSIFPKAYNVYRLDRSSATHPFETLNPLKFRKNGGGVLIAHRNDINLSSHRFCKFSTQAELLTVFFKHGNTSFSVSTFYRVNNLAHENFSNFCDYMLNLVKSKGFKKHILIGDFNLPSAILPDSQKTTIAKLFTDFLCGDLGHSQIVNSATHDSSHTLDLAFTNCPEFVSEVNVLENGEVCFSDHYGITMSVGSSKCREHNNARSCNDFEKADFLGLNVGLSRVNWDSLISEDVEMSWANFKCELLELTNRHIPKKRIRGSFTPPWYDSECKKAREKKERLRKRFNKLGTQKSKHAYNSARLTFKETMCKKINNYLDVSTSNSLSKRFWSHVKTSSKTTRIPETMYCKDVSRSNPLENASLFNNFFASQFTPPSNYSIEVNNSPLDSKCFFSISEVYKALTDIDPSKACGPDGIHGLVLKNCAGSLSYPLWLMFNYSIRTSVIPSDWKHGSIVPVHKKGDKRDVSNYRPISLLPLVAKILERLVKSRLATICDPLIDPRQHGFMDGKSCDTQLLPFTYSLATNVSSGIRTDVVYFDFARAFDSVNHDIILHKLKYNFGIDGLLLSFIKSYLSGRTQSVCVDGFSSERLPVTSGVPQGSILGPLLFIIFINDIFNEVTPGTDISLYADDTKIWRPIESTDDHESLQSSIDRLHEWAVTNKMIFHPEKCKVLSVSNARGVSLFSHLPFFKFHYSLNGILIDYVTHHKDLGVIISSDLSWNRHCDYIVHTMTTKFNLIRRTCYFLKKSSAKRSLYLSMVRSLLEHCNPVWCHIGKTQLSALEKVQKRAVKWIRNEPVSSYSNTQYLSYLNELGLLPIKQLFEYSDLRLFYKVVNSLIPVSLPVSITAVNHQTLRQTRQNNAITLGLDNSSYIDKTRWNTPSVVREFFYHRTAKLWNSVPYTVRQSSSYPVFLKRLKLHLSYNIDPETLF